MKKINKVYNLLFLILFLFSSISMLFAQATVPAEKKLNPKEALQYIEAKEQEIEKWVKIEAKRGSKKYIEKDAVLKKSVDELIDSEFIAKYALGKRWDNAPADKRDKLHSLLKEMFTEFYLEHAFYDKSYQKKYIDQGLEEMYIKGMDKSLFIISEIEVVFKKKPVIYEVVYHVYRKDGQKEYMIFDIELDGVSLSRNYRSQFSKKYKDYTIDQLIEKIDKKLKKKIDKKSAGKDDSKKAKKAKKAEKVVKVK